MPEPAPSGVETGAKVAAACLIGLEQLLKERHCDATASLMLKARAEPDPETTDVSFIPLQSFVELLETVASTSGNANLGLHLAERYQPAGDHALAYAVLNAPNLRIALATLARFHNTRVTARASFIDEGSSGRYEWSYPGSVSPIRMVIDFAAVRILQYIRTAAGPGWQPPRVWLSRGEPDDMAEYERLFGKRLTFNWPVNAIMVDGPALAAPIPNADEILHRIMIRHCERLLKDIQDGSDPVARVRHYIESTLQSGPNLEDAANYLNATPSALRRTLKSANITFKSLVDRTRRDLARHYLVDTNLPLYEVGSLLGFSEQSAFSRAARRWFGVSPGTFRRKET